MIGRLALRVNSRFRHIPGFDTDGAGEEDVDCTPKVSQEIKGASHIDRMRTMLVPRQQYSRELKIVCMRELDSGKSMAEIARQYQLSPKRLETWES
jgi:hypothetical protein